MSATRTLPRADPTASAGAGERGPHPPRALRVLYVDHSVGFGGATKSLALTLRALGDVQPFVLTTQRPALIRTWFGGYAVRRFRTVVNYELRERVQRLLAAHRALRWLALKAVALLDVAATAWNATWLTWLLRREGIDLIHLNNGFHPQEALLAGRLARVPCIVHLRDLPRGTPRPGSSTARYVAWVITDSAAVAEGLAETAASTLPVTVIHEPVDVEAIERGAPARARIRAACGLGPDDVAVAIFGRIVEWKGQKVFVQAALEAMRANPAIRALVVGDESDGGRAYLSQVRKLVADSGLGQRFLFTGYREDVEEYYAAADIVVHASILPEPFGMVVAEAMAAGRPVIASDAGGPRETVTAGEDGLLVPPGDVPALARAILELAADPARRARMGASGQRKIVQRLNLDANARRVRDVYEAVLDAGRASARPPRPAP